MMDFDAEKRRFVETCTGCGTCVTVCPIIPMTDIRNIDPESVMKGVQTVFREGVINDISRQRIFSCMNCLTCRPHCPEGLNPALGLSLARGILQDMGEPLPRGLAFLLPETEFNLMKAIAFVQVKPGERAWVTDAEKRPPKPSETVIFTGCTGIMQPDLILTALDLIRRIDPTAQVLGGVDYCCGDTSLRAGRPGAAKNLFLKLVSALNAFSPKQVVLMCPTCQDFFNLHNPRTNWSRQFVTNFLAEHLPQLGPLQSIPATVTIHDACHQVRGENPDSASPRKILEAIPGIRIIEMPQSKDSALCCGGSAMAAVGKPGVAFRTLRLEQAREIGADIMVQYCPGCQSVFAPERPHLPFQVESLITLLGRAAGISHEDKLMHYLSLQDGDAVLREAGECIQASDLPAEKLRNFIPKYFKGAAKK